MGKQHSLPVVAALALTVLTGTAWPQALGPETSGERAPLLLIVALPQMSWRNLRSADMPLTNRLLEQAASGLMPIASPADSEPNRTWVTLGAGRAAVGDDLRGAPLEQGGFALDVSALRSANQRAHTAATPGLLGGGLHASGLTTAVIAYRMSSRTAAPPGVAVLMDEKGRVDGGSLYDPSDSSLLGKRLDRKQVRSALDDTVAHFDVVLLDLSGVRVDPELDDVIAEAAEAVGSRRGILVLLCALSPAYREGDTRRIGFVVWRDFSRREPPTERLLTSASTRWRGIVSPADFAPTVLVQCIHPPPDAYARRAGGIEFFRQALYENMSGRPAEAVPSRAALSELDRLDLMLSERDRLRKTAALMWGICSLALAGVALLLALRERKEVQWLAVPALAMALFPVGLLLAPLAGMGQARQLLVATGVAVGGALSAARLPRSSQSVGVPLLLGVGIIALDVVFGSPLMRQSPLGFSVLSGSRFYGIGNEYAGVMGAMITIGLGALLGARSPRVWLTVAMAAVVLLVVGSPWWGANWGGYVALAAGLMALWVGTSRRRGRAAALGALALVAMALVPAALDLLRSSGDRSHIGTATAALLSGQFGIIGDMVQRKILMNWRIAAGAGWWWAAAIVPLLAVQAFLRREGWARVCLAREPFLATGLASAVVTAGVAMVVNDSGVVSLATALAVAFGVLIFVAARAEMSPG